MSKLASKAQSPLKWHLVSNEWKLPSTHPFYYDKKSQKQEESKMNYNEEDEEELKEKNKYSIWSSGWSSSIIGQSYLNECGQSLTEMVQYGSSQKMFGDVELDLVQCKEDLLAYADSYAPIEELNIEPDDVD